MFASCKSSMFAGALWAIAAAFLAPGCNSTDPPTERQSTATVSANSNTDASFPLTVTDVLNRQVTIRSAPKRIVSLAPRNTEILFALGAGELLVGVTSFCNYPPEAAKIEQVGGFSGPTVNLEKLVALKPDLVLTAGNLHEPLIARLEELGMVVVALYAESFEEMYRELELAGRITDTTPRADKLAASLRERINAIEKLAQSIPTERQRKVMYLVADDPLMVAGPKSFIGRLMENCGAENAFADVAQAYPQIGEEAVLARDPEVLLAPSSFDTPAFREQLAHRPGWPNLAALRNERVVFLDEDLLSRCGPRSAEAQEVVAKAIYPEYFSEEFDRSP